MKKFLNLLFILINCYFISSYAMNHEQIISTIQKAYFESVEKVIPLIQSSQISDFKSATCITLDTKNEKMAIGFYDGTVQIRSQKDHSLIESTLQYARNNVKSIHFMPYQETPNSIIVEQSSSEASVLTFSQYPQIITDNDRSVILERPIRTISFNPTKLFLFLQNTDEQLTPYFCLAEKKEWQTNSGLLEPNVNIATFYSPLMKAAAGYDKNNPYTLLINPLNQQFEPISSKKITLQNNAIIEHVIFSSVDDSIIAIITAQHTNNKWTSYNSKGEQIATEFFNSRISIWNYRSGMLLTIINDIPNKKIMSAALNNNLMAFVFDDGTIDLHMLKKASSLIGKPYMKNLLIRSLGQLYSLSDGPVQPCIMTTDEYEEFSKESKQSQKNIMQFFNIKTPHNKLWDILLTKKLFFGVSIPIILLILIWIKYSSI